MDKQGDVAKRLEQMLTEGHWGLFDRLPGERELARKFGINRGTLRSALHILVGKGILETRHGSGTFVRMLPTGAARKTDAFRDCIVAFRLFAPPLVRMCQEYIQPSTLLELERLLPVAATSMQTDDIKAFILAQIRFFSILTHCTGNLYLKQVITLLLPDGVAFSRLLHECPMIDKEALFAQLARLLSALRHADAAEAGNAVWEYAQLLLNLLEREK